GCRRLPPPGETDQPRDGDRIAPGGHATGRHLGGVTTGHRSARSDRLGGRSLDAISVPRSLAAPSGKTYGTERPVRGSTRLSTSSPGAASPPSTISEAVWTGRGQGPCRPRSGRSAADGEHLHLGQPVRRGRGPELRVAVAAHVPDAGDQVPQVGVRGAGAERTSEVPTVHPEETRVELAVGGEARPRAIPAE